MEGFQATDLFNNEEKYNKLIRETDTLQKFEEIFLQLLADEELEMSTILALMKIIEHDVILVNQLTEATSLMEMTESFIRYMLMKNDTSQKTDVENKKDIEKKKEEKDKTPKSLKKTAKNTLNIQKRVRQEESKNQKKTQIGNITCDCRFPDKHQN